MTKYIIIIALVIVMGVAVLYKEGYLNTDIEAGNTIEKEEVIVEVEVLGTTFTDEDAIKAAEDVILKKELEASLEEVNNEIWYLEIRKEEIEKSLGLY